ncbi:MAG: hypothetical protein IJ348_03795 [Alistipes sp.]|nr:hypothetical protein [Alistipes sp.]
MSHIKVKVVVPIYTERLEGRELLSFRHNAEVLHRYPMAIVAPEGLNVDAVVAEAPQCEVVRVTRDWLGGNGIAGYNRMMLSKEFYELFSDCTYILICQPDAWIFRDELEQWCDRGFDYVGAPWPKRKRYDMPIVKQYLWLRKKLFSRPGRLMRQDYFNKVGNGGLSLRRIGAFAEACDRYRDVIEEFKVHRGTLWNEDWFWALIPKEFSYPTFDKALGFSFDVYPRRCHTLAEGHLPMGCHGWFKRRNLPFWQPIIEGGNEK